MIARVLLVLVLIGMMGLLALMWGIPLVQFPGEPELSGIDGDAVLVVFSGSLVVALISVLPALVARRSSWVVRGLYFVVAALALLRVVTTYPLLQG